MKTPTIVFLHGFLGEPEDWLPVIAHLPCEYQCEALDLNAPDPLVHAKILLEKQLSSFFLVGYSMGGRIAWQLASMFSFALEGMILLGAHPGLDSEEERKERLKSDQYWIDLLQTGDMSDFLQKWYSQPLFATVRKKEELIAKRMKRDPVILADMMRTMSLGRQPKLSPFSPTLFLYGIEDVKYGKMYSNQEFVEAIPDAGHAAHIENPEAVASAIKRFVEENS